MTITIALWWGIPLGIYIIALVAVTVWLNSQLDRSSYGGPYGGIGATLSFFVGASLYLAATVCFLLYMVIALWWRGP